MIFVDTGAFLARYLAKDQHNSAAVSGWKRLAEGHERCFTSNFVLNETFTLLARRAGYHFAARKARDILSSQTLNIIRPSKEDELEAIDLFEKYADQEVSFTDCVSFSLMRRGRIKQAFSFDRHFTGAGFELWS